MTPRQQAYVEHRAAGLGKAAAARAAKFAVGSAKVAAARLERSPEIRQAIAANRSKVSSAPDTGLAAIAEGGAQATGAAQFDDPEAFLRAVICGAVAADTAVRVAAARVLIAYTKPRVRVYAGAQTPRQVRQRAALESEHELLDAWAVKAAAVRARLARERRKRP